MADKKTSHKSQQELKLFSLPESGISIEAENAQDAVEKAKKLEEKE